MHPASSLLGGIDGLKSRSLLQVLTNLAHSSRVCYCDAACVVCRSIRELMFWGSTRMVRAPTARVLLGKSSCPVHIHCYYFFFVAILAVHQLNAMASGLKGIQITWDIEPSEKVFRKMASHSLVPMQNVELSRTHFEKRGSSCETRKYGSLFAIKFTYPEWRTRARIAGQPGRTRRKYTDEGLIFPLQIPISEMI